MDRSSCQEHDTLAQLSAAERLFVWGVRSVAQYQRLGWPTVAEIRRVYDQFRVGDAVPSLEALLEAFACTAHTAIELHCPVCRRLSPSEHRLLQAVSAVQCERFDIACEQFEHWLPPVATEWALAPARGLATLFRIACLRLPNRNAHPIENDGTMTMQSWLIGSPTMH
jgi:hypothetical protein